MTAETNEQLIQKYRQTGEQELRDWLVLENMGLVFHIVRKKFHWLDLSPDEIRSNGTVSLLNAIDKFDLARGATFAGYAGMIITRDLQDLSVRRFFTASIGRGKMQKSVLIYIPRRMNEYVEQGMSPVDALIQACADFKVTVDRAAEIFEAAHAPSPTLVNEATASIEEEYADPDATLPIVVQCLKAALDDRERDVVRRHFLMEEDFPDIAADYGLTVERIRQIKRAAMPKLAREMKRRGLSMGDFDLN
ncbi:sigma-70 family RNA polymerase sigma factor [Salipiger manganoxidans]|uniref:sigma-70 family RNA polymerase sigma factor n=1 Tax=Salipiger marinus TaxID=555512 RepID=UPI001E35A099|nr:sigma-70 family RNA polymerase sigma factor [Salipiger manganoxidans]MCD1621194.1 sigma-70 family RNA polymerase sigma factor [Salipiger manganoxidans]